MEWLYLGMKDTKIKRIVWAVLIAVGLLAMFACTTPEPSLRHCYDHEWRDVLNVDLPAGGEIIINGQATTLPRGSYVVIIGNERN